MINLHTIILTSKLIKPGDIQAGYMCADIVGKIVFQSGGKSNGGSDWNCYVDTKGLTLPYS